MEVCDEKTIGRLVTVFSCSSVFLFLYFPCLPYFVGFQLFGLIGAQEGQNQVDDWVESTFKLLMAA